MTGMRPNTAQANNCAILGTLEVLGDLWSLGVLRCVFTGTTRFSAMQRTLGIASNVLADRLNRLVALGILDRVVYQQRPVRHEYRATAKGLELAPALLALREWGTRHLSWAGDLAPLAHAGCGGRVRTVPRCEACAAEVPVREVAIPLATAT